jgi:hypothetical protein
MKGSTTPGQSAGHNFLPHPDPMTFFLDDVLVKLQEAHQSGRISDNDMEMILQKTRETLQSTKDLFTQIAIALIK